MNRRFEKVKTDKNGNYLLIDITVQGRKLTLANVYGPNQDNPQFYNTLFQKISEFENDEIVLCGDWNFVIDPDRDYDNYLHINNPRSRQVTLDYMAEHNILDIWRVMNENRKQFTWRRKNPVRKQVIFSY